MPVLRNSLATLLSTVSLLALSTVAWADIAPTTLPTGGAVAGGSATISQQNATMTVNQSSQKAIINWQAFNVGSAAQVTFNQPNSAAIALNRVLSAAPSAIEGKIVANGQVWLINPAGVVFGAGAVANVGGLVASTMGIADSDFMAGNYVFNRNGSTATIVNSGTLTANPGGMIALLAPELRNEGTISAQLGTVVMAAGEQVVLNIDTSGGGITVQVDPAQIYTMIENHSMVVADNGAVILSAKAADALIGSSINNTGVIEAASLTSKGGSIELSGATVIENSGTLDASGATGGTIDIAADQTAGQATVGGNVSVAGKNGTGGKATITGNHVLVADGAHIDATGTMGGGTIDAGGSWEAEDASVPESVATVVAPTAVLDASATVNGDGGTVIARSDVTNPNSVTRAYGTFLANGGPQGGNGGRIETSGYWLDTASAQGGAFSLYGKSGVWLFDPYDVTINSSSSTDGSFSGSPSTWTPSAEGSTIAAGDIQADLNGGTSVTITTAGSGSDKGNIIVDSAIDKTSGNTDVTLTLSANTDIQLNANIDNSGGTGKLNVQLNADNQHTGTGIIYLDGDITTGGGYLTFGDGSTANLDGNTTLVGGDVYVNDTVGHTLSTGGGDFQVNGQVIIKDAGGLSVNSGGGNVTFAGAVDSGDDYALISAPNTDWTTDFAAAKSGTGANVGDTYMATVTSHLEGEIVALTTIVSGSFQAVWLGAERVTGIGTDNIWRWVGGPEGLKDNGNGLPFFQQNGSDTVNGNGGTSINGMYVNWNGGEPNNSSGGNLSASGTNESIMQTLGASGLWNDLPKTGNNLDYYVQETNVADSPLSVNSGSGLVTFGGTVGGNKPISTLTITTNASQIDINGGGVYTDSTQTYTVPISMGSNNVTLAVLDGNLVTRSGQTYSSDSGEDSNLTLSASGNLELTSDTDPIANGHKLGLTLISGGTLSLDSSVSLDSNGGAVVMEADSLSVDPAASVVGGATGSLQIEPYTQGTSMGIGTGAGTLNVGTADFTSNFINNTFGTVIFGGPTTGLLTVGSTPALIHDKTVFESGGDMALASDADINPTGLVAFQLDSINTTMTENSSAVVDVGSMLLSGNSFYLSGTGAFNLNGSHNTVATLAAANAASIDFVNQGSLAVGTVGNADIGTTDGVSATGDITLQASGATADLTLSEPVTSSGGNIVMAADRNFLNNNASDTGIVASGSGKQFFVYSSDPSTTTEGMTSYNKHYDQTYTANSTPSYASSGNWFLYSLAPVLTENLSPASVNYGNSDPAVAATYTGYIDGDSSSNAGITGTTATIQAFTASGAGKRPVGTYTTTPSPGTLASTLGYSFTAGSSNMLTVDKINATVSSFTAADKFFNGNVSATITSIGGLGGILSGDVVTAAGGVADFDSSAVGDGKTVTEKSVIAGGRDGGNYNITTSGLTALASIKPSSVFVPPVNTINVTPPPPNNTAIQPQSTSSGQPTQPGSPGQPGQITPLVSGNANSITVPQGLSSGGINSPSVIVTTISSGAGDGGILATVGEDSSFKFIVPQNNFVTPGSANTITASLPNGGALPVWLIFDPAHQTFSANNVPPDGLPIVVAVNDVNTGKKLEITISQ